MTLTGCATTLSDRDAVGNPRIDRITAAEMARLGPARPAKLSADDLVRLSEARLSPEQIIDRYYQSGSRLKLTDTQLVDLRRRGVDPRVLDYVVQAEQEAEKVDAITAQADREANERARRESWFGDGYYNPWGGPYPSYWGPSVYPYFGFGWNRWGSGWFGGFGIGF